MNTSLKTLQGGTRLLFDSIEGITNTVESMHESIAARVPVKMPLAAYPAHGAIASGVYKAIRGINAGLRVGADKTFELLPPVAGRETMSDGEIRTRAALNGVCGDHLEETGNPLAIDMSIRTRDQALELNAESLARALPQASPHLVILLHGLTLSELSWRRNGSPGIGYRLQSEFGHSALYLRYNTGRHISSNGREFAQLLETLCASWPVPVESISLVGHSMGGLVIRSACWYAGESQQDWLPLLRRVVCLGTPHHGSPLERAGHAFETAMQKIPHSEPLLLGKRRSVGVKDLRYGSLLDEDWQDIHPDHAGPDSHTPVPLVPGVSYYFAAASLGRDREDPLGHLLGDLLVRPDSAVGLHKDELRKLQIKPGNCQIFHEKNHYDLLDDERVHAQIMDWFAQ